MIVLFSSPHISLCHLSKPSGWETLNEPTWDVILAFLNSLCCVENGDVIVSVISGSSRRYSSSDGSASIHDIANCGGDSSSSLVVVIFLERYLCL